MRRLSTLRRWSPSLVLALCGLLPYAAVAAPVSEREDKPRAETTAEKLRQALDQTHDLELTDQNLATAINSLREQTKLNIVLDQLGIMSMGMAPEQMPVTNVSLKKVKVRSALRTLLSPYHLTYAIIGDSVVITTEDMAHYRQMRQPVSIDVDKVPMSKALRQLSRETVTNVLLDTKVQKEADTPVTLQLDDVPLETAVRLLCEMVGLKPVRVGNVLYVTNKTTAAELRNDPDLMPAPGNPQNPAAVYANQQQLQQLQLQQLQQQIQAQPQQGVAPPPPVPQPAPAPVPETAPVPSSDKPSSDKPAKPEPPIKDDKP